MDLESIAIKLEICISEYLKVIFNKATEFFSLTTEKDMKANFTKICTQVKVSLQRLMDHIMKVNSKMISDVVLVNIGHLRQIIMKENSRMKSIMVMGCYRWMEVDMKESFRSISIMGRGLIKMI